MSSKESVLFHHLLPEPYFHSVSLDFQVSLGFQVALGFQVSLAFQVFPVSPVFPALEAAAQRARAQADGTALAPPDTARRAAADLEIAALARRMRTQGATLLKAASLRQAKQAFPGKAFQPAALPAMESQGQW